MQKKQAAEYRRYSKDKQSNFSLERQGAVNNTWAAANNVSIVDIFSDDGHSARTFDRPDAKRLFAFIKKNHSRIDYIIVAELSRFSRDLADAMNMIKSIQREYNIRIVSAGSNHICDAFEHTSFIRMALEFTFSNADNLARQSHIKGGIHTGKKLGRYINSKAPYGYYKISISDNEKQLAIDPAKAAIVQFIFSSYIKGQAVATILTEARKLGFTVKGKSVIQDIIINPVYISMQQVQPWKEEPGGLYPGTWEPIIDSVTFYKAQDMVAGSKRKGISVDSNYPLRGVLNCYCGVKMTAAPSKGRNGTYYDYYKCNNGKSHNNVSATIAHNNLNEILAYMSLPVDMVAEIKAAGMELLQQELQANKAELQRAKTSLARVTANLYSLEEKFIGNDVGPETYQRLQPKYAQERATLQTTVEELSKSEGVTYDLLQNNIDLLTDLPALYNTAPLLDKQELLNHWFDRQLYIKERIYRTTFLMDIFSHSELILREKQLLYVERKTGFIDKARICGDKQTIIEPTRLTSLLTIVQAIQVA